jgi:16S rRNA A1518/A1519 N6-dimethyltransferase RsmA/KsgA/DIM1 with predicted DNA glycosylase/AP lyase activity
VDPGEAALAALSRAGIDPTTRPERLTPDDFVRLFRAVRGAP